MAVDGKIDDESGFFCLFSFFSFFFFFLFSMGTAPWKLLELMAGDLGINKRQQDARAQDASGTRRTHPSTKHRLIR